MSHSGRMMRVGLSFGMLALCAGGCGSKHSGGGNDNTNNSSCGDGVVGAGESCDGTDLGGETCASLGLIGGTLGCTQTCELDVGGCQGQPACGNGVREYPEVCDGTDLAGQDCVTQGFDTGSLACLGDCTGFDTSSCSSTCGDGVRNGSEVCDGSDLGGQDCASQGFYAGTLGCLPGCSAFDLTSCAGTCGDGVVDSGQGEECDEGSGNSDVTPNACRESCRSPACGDGVVDDANGEECDDGNTAGGDGCSATCTLQLPPSCTITAPANFTRQPYDADWTFVAQATDAEDGALSGASVQWLSDVLGPLGNGLSLTLVLDPPYEHQITCIATDSDAMTGSDTITVNADSPVAEIWHPGDGETRADCPTNIPFVGVARDYEDGDITSSLVWTSDLDGLIGTGGNFSQCLAGLGLNTITATATDSANNDATATISLNIVP